MSTTTIKISELRGVDDENVKDLAALLEGKTKAKVEVTSGEIILKYEKGETAPPRAYLRMLLRKFLYRAELKEDFRVIAGAENTFIIKEKKKAEEE